jgi:putative nucleotide binding protein
MTARPPTKKFEEYAYVLDHLPRGYPEDTRPIFKKDPIVQAVGDTYFTLLELVPRKGARFNPQESIFIGRDRRDKIDHVKRRITFDLLTATARSELPFVIEKLVEKSEPRFVEFFNNARPLTTRMHSLELLPGIGKKLMRDILEERRKAPFTSFQDVAERTQLRSPKEIIVKRILMELGGEEKYNLFTRKPVAEKDQERD